MNFTEQTLALCPDAVFYNKLDREALSLCLRLGRQVRRFKGNPCVPAETRMTLEEHVYDIAASFVRLEATQNVLQNADKDSPEYRFAIETLRTILRHDMGESIFELQTYLQKIDPTLPKIDGAPFESGVSAALYHLAQHAILADKTHDFMRQMGALQQDYAHFDATISDKKGDDYSLTMLHAFDRVLERLQDYSQLLPTLYPHEMERIATNDKKHKRDCDQIDNPEIQAQSPAGLFTKIADYANVEETHYALDKLHQPSLPYQHVGERFNDYVFIACKRAEKFLPAFVDLAKQHAWLQPFLTGAYHLAYTRVASLAMVAGPIVALPDGTNITDKEAAARALCYRTLCPPLQKGLFSDPLPSDATFEKLYKETLADLQGDRTLDDIIRRVHAICGERFITAQQQAA